MESRERILELIAEAREVRPADDDNLASAFLQILIYAALDVRELAYDVRELLREQNKATLMARDALTSMAAAPATSPGAPVEMKLNEGRATLPATPPVYPGIEQRIENEIARQAPGSDPAFSDYLSVVGNHPAIEQRIENEIARQAPGSDPAYSDYLSVVVNHPAGQVAIIHVNQFESSRELVLSFDEFLLRIFGDSGI